MHIKALIAQVAVQPCIVTAKRHAVCWRKVRGKLKVRTEDPCKSSRALECPRALPIETGTSEHVVVLILKASPLESINLWFRRRGAARGVCGQCKKNPSLEMKPVSESRVLLTELVTPSHVTPAGHVYGGQLLCWMDVAAGVVAKRHGDNPAVTASVDSVHFIAPIRLGNAAVIKARATRAWNTSMEIEVVVLSEDLASGIRRLCCRAFFTFVGVTRTISQADAKKSESKVKMPALDPQTKREKERFEEAQLRRERRINNSARSSEKMTRTARSRDQHFMEIISSRYPRGTCRVLKIIMPEHANSLGITFGGIIMQWMEYAAYVAACRIAGTDRLVSAAMDRLQFHGPTRIGDLVSVFAGVTRVFGKSVEVHVRVIAEQPEADSEVLWTNDGWITFVATDSKGSPESISTGAAGAANEDFPSPTPLEQEFTREKVLSDETAFASAIDRKKSRLEQREALLHSNHKNIWDD